MIQPTQVFEDFAEAQTSCSMVVCLCLDFLLRTICMLKKLSDETSWTTAVLTWQIPQFSTACSRHFYDGCLLRSACYFTVEVKINKAPPN